jgi:hypothetical protein
MTKLKLNLAQVVGEILTRDELKRIVGGAMLTTCIRSKGYETILTKWEDASPEFISGWTSVWEGLGWEASCTTMLIAPGSGSGSGSVFV